MQISSRLLIASASGVLTIALACGCTRGGGGHASGPVVPTASGAASPTTHYVEPTQHARSPVPEEMKGFENDLPAPEGRGGGPPVPGVDSDIGEPRWRNNPGSYDDDGPGRGATPPRGEEQKKQRERALPPDLGGLTP